MRALRASALGTGARLASCAQEHSETGHSHEQHQNQYDPARGGGFVRHHRNNLHGRASEPGGEQDDPWPDALHRRSPAHAATLQRYPLDVAMAAVGTRS